MAFVILSIDDESDASSLLKVYLIGSGVNVLAEHSGREGLNAAIREQPNLIFLDLQMPDMDGFETLAQLKQNPRTADIPVVMLTGNIESENISRAQALGALAYIIKFPNRKEVLSLIAMTQSRRSEDDLRPERHFTD